MKLNLGNAKPKETKPQTSLQEKTSGHSFSLPKTKPVAETSKEAAPQTKPAANGFRLGETKPVAKQEGQPPVADKAEEVEKSASPVQAANAIPQVSDEKFNIVEGAEAEISQESGDKFREMLQLLEANIDSEGDLQRILKGTMEHLQQNPELDAVLRPEDRAIFVRAARKSYGITLAGKTTRKAKTTKLAQKVDDLMDELADLDFTL